MNFVEASFLGRKFFVSDKYPIPIYFDSEHVEPPQAKYWTCIRPDEVVVDVGAAFGTYTLTALLLGARVIAYEPCVDEFNILTEEVNRNGWETRCILRRMALGNGSKYPPELFNEVWTIHYPTKLDEIRFSTLDEDLTTPVDWIKCDNEGGELLFLQGASETIERHHPNLIIEDHDGVDLEGKTKVSTWPQSIKSSGRIHAMLRSMGYAIEVMKYDISRKFIVAIHPSRGKLIE